MGSTSTVVLPLLPLRDVVVYPHMVLPLFVGREKSIEALEDAMANDKQVLLVAQRHAADDDPGARDIYQMGTVSNILQLLKLPDGTIKVLVEGGYRAAVEQVVDRGQYVVATVREVICEDIPEGEMEAMLRSILEGVLLDSMYNIPSRKDVSKVVIDESVIRGDSEPLLVYQSHEPVARAASTED